MDDCAGRRAQCDGDAVRHAVRDADELDLHHAGGDAFTRRDGDQSSGRIDTVRIELGTEQRKGQRGAVDRPLDAIPDVGDGADMVLVAMRKDDRRHPPVGLFQKR